jgi:AraC-like DNA-binding protein
VNWIQSLSRAIDFIEKNLTNELSIDELARQAYTSSSHFQLVFHLVMGITVGEYIRNRRMSLAAQDLLQPTSKIMDVAIRYQYDTQESFSKAFTRFHGVPPSKIQRGRVRMFHPLTININIQGGFDMTNPPMGEFYLVDWNEIDDEKGDKLSGIEKYKRLVSWAAKARGQNPGSLMH